MTTRRKSHTATILAAAAVAAAALTALAARAGSTPAGAPPSTAPSAPTGSCSLPADVSVTKVTDGDTIHVTLCGADTTVRIIGVNTPETKKPRTPVQCFGPQASAYAHQRLDGQTVHLVGDRKAGVRDKYGRTLAFVEVGGDDYGAAAVRAGLAEANDYGHRESRTDEYVMYEAQAKRDRVGAWVACPAPFKS